MLCDTHTELMLNLESWCRGARAPRVRTLRVMPGCPSGAAHPQATNAGPAHHEGGGEGARAKAWLWKSTHRLHDQCNVSKVKEAGAGVPPGTCCAIPAHPSTPSLRVPAPACPLCPSPTVLPCSLPGHSQPQTLLTAAEGPSAGWALLCPCVKQAMILTPS